MPSSPTPDAELAPLAGPAVVVAALMLVVAAAEARNLTGWAHDYGPPLVWTALVQYLCLAAGLLWWGLRCSRARR